MSRAIVMIPCNKCGGEGKVIRYMPLNFCQKYFQIEDICDKCGGSGKVAF